MNQVALYLNLATTRIKKDGNTLTYLGLPGVELNVAPGREQQETQILFVRDALGIANNDDSDSLCQKALLEKLGVSTPDNLIEHVANYQGRVFERIKKQKK